MLFERESAELADQGTFGLPAAEIALYHPSGDRVPEDSGKRARLDARQAARALTVIYHPRAGHLIPFYGPLRAGGGA